MIEPKTNTQLAPKSQPTPAPTTRDTEAYDGIAMDVNLMVPWYLMASYLYYQEDYSLFSDQFYDQLCKDMIANWDRITHRHKHLVSLDSLRAGTGYSLRKEDYPGIARSAAINMMRESQGLEPIYIMDVTPKLALMPPVALPPVSQGDVLKGTI